MINTSNTTKLFTVLVIDDMPENLDVMKGVLLNEYNIKMTTNPKASFKILGSQKIDIILLDIMMPEMDGYQVCKQLKSNPQTADIPVIFVSAMSDLEDEQKGFDVGAVDYITKPIKPALVKSRVKTHLLLADQMRASKLLIEEQIQELRYSQESAIHMLGEAGHYNDTDTGVHIWRMASYAAALAQKSLWSVDDARILELAAPMHDTGKIGISDEILKAPRKLTDEEMEIMKQHTVIGHKILSKANNRLFNLAAEVALYHHEKWDGSGYPYGLKGTEIPESARIVAIADVFDALTMKRPYKEAWPFEEAFKFIEDQSGKHFDPSLVPKFIAMKEELILIKDNWEQKSTNID
nr:HD domain-containing phosphohydrolase [Lelliottia steviae]